MSALDTISSFGAALSDAVHDASHESDPSRVVVHYWDTASIFQPVRGFRGFETTTSRDPADLVVQALFAAGMLGPIALTASHRIEFLRLLDRWTREDGERSTSYQQDARRFLARHQLQRIDDLARAVRYATRSGDASEAFAELRGLDRLDFAYVESLNGPWPARLKRLVADKQLLNLGSPGPAHEEIADDRRFSALVEEVRRQRERSGGSSLSVAFDASALTAVAILNERAVADSSQPYVRFYTSSSSLKRVWRGEGWVRELYEFPLDPLGSRYGTVWRTSDYYLLRAIFPSLSPRSAYASLPGSPSFEELKALSEQMEAARAASESELVHLARSYVFDSGADLAHLIAEFEAAGMAQVWLSYDISDFALELVDGLNSIRKLRTIESTNGILAEALQAAGASVEEKTTEVAFAMSIVEPLWMALSRMVPAKAEPTVSITQELGSVRWGLIYPDDSDRIASPTHDAGQASQQILSFLSISELARSVTEVQRLAAVLIGLELYRPANHVLSYARAASTSSLALTLMGLVCQVELARERDDIALAADAVVDFWSDLDPPDQDSLVLGCAYAMFVAWEGTRGQEWIRHPRDDHDWARWSFESVRDRRHRLSGIAADFALNHLVYVGTIAGIRDPELSAFALELEARVRRVPNYRFLDTLGFRQYLLAVRGLSGRKPTAHWRQSHCPQLISGVESLRRAVSLAPADREVMEHLSAVVEFASAIGCLGAAK